VSKEAEGLKYGGHSSHVTNVHFTCDDRYVLSTGGADLSIFQWRHRGEGIPDVAKADDSGAQQGPSADGDDDEDEDVKTLTAEHSEGKKKEAPDDTDEFAVAEEAGEQFMAVKPWVGQVHPPTNWQDPKDVSKPPKSTLELEFVHGCACQMSVQ
jgi:microtubule-associated protein-like 6